MSFRHPLPRPARSPSTSSSSTTASDESAGPPTARPRQPDDMDHRQDRRVFSQSTPSLGNQLDGANNSTNNSTESDGDAPRSLHPPRHHSHGAIASHFLAQPPDTYGGQTWVDFLRESGVDDNGNGSHHPRHTHTHTNMPPPTDTLPRASSSRFTLPAHPPRPTEPSRTARGSDRKRRLTTPESPMRRPSSIRMRPDAAAGSGSSSDPILLDSSPALTRPPPPPSFPSQSSAAGLARRESESSIVLPSWQPDADVSHCPVCGSQFTFFYRKHHCRYVISKDVLCSTLFSYFLKLHQLSMLTNPEGNADESFALRAHPIVSQSRASLSSTHHQTRLLEPTSLT